jgi:DNA replication and repair protein RecF
LDIDRRAALIEELLTLDAQVFMTGTDASLFEAFQGRAQMLAVNTGQIKLL